MCFCNWSFEKKNKSSLVYSYSYIIYREAPCRLQWVALLIHRSLVCYQAPALQCALEQDTEPEITPASMAYKCI